MYLVNYYWPYFCLFEQIWGFVVDNMIKHTGIDFPITNGCSLIQLNNEAPDVCVRNHNHHDQCDFLKNTPICCYWIHHAIS